MAKSEKDILAVLGREIHNASGFIGGELVARRKKSLQYYLGMPLGNEQEGRSQVISNDVLDTVESLMPSLMRIFTSGDNVFSCEGTGPEDDEMARQCSDYLNYIFYKENSGFLALYSAFKDALIQKNGILKVYWDDSQKTEREEYTRLSDDEFGFSTFNLNEFINLTDEYVLSSLLSSKSSKLKRARQFALDYQNRKLLKCVFERILTSRTGLKKTRTDELRTTISKKSKVDENEIFVDSSVTPSIPLAPSKNESKSIILISNENGKSFAKEMPISEIPVVSAISGFMNILRIYTHEKNRKKVEIAAKSIIGGLK